MLSRIRVDFGHTIDSWRALNFGATIAHLKIRTHRRKPVLRGTWKQRYFFAAFANPGT